MKLIYSLALLFLFQIGYSQYEPLQSRGDIPKDFTTPSYVKYQKELENVDRDAKRRTRKNQKEFFLESNFGIDDLLKSGRVMFNDPVTAYVNDIADILLKDEPRLKKELRFYAVRTPSVNAFATNQGVILINMGLIAQLENEAQLAFILAHEISHFKEKHALEFFLEAKQIERANNRGYFRNKDFDGTLAKNQFSKDQESEADELGLEIYLKSNYDLESVQGAFDVLQFSYLPFDNIPFNKSYFEDEYLVFKKSYQLDSLNAITVDASDDDSESTHPSLPKRRTAAEKIIGSTSNDGRKNFIVSESRFKELQLKARYEILDYHLRGYEFYEAMYSAYMLQKKYPDDVYLKKVIAKSLYGMTKFVNARRWTDVKIKAKNVEGEFGSLVHFINKTSKLEINVLALRYIYMQKDLFPNDPVYADMVEDICLEFVNTQSKKLDKFKIGKAPAMVATQMEEEEEEEEEVELITPDDNEEENEDEEKSKLDKIREQKKEKKKTDEEKIEYIYYGLGDLLDQEDFKSLLEKCKDKKEEDEEREEELESMSQKDRYIKSGNFALGENKILLINPFYMKLSKNFEEPLLIPTEKAQQEYSAIVQKNAERLGLKLVILDAHDFSKNDVESFNDLREIQDWYGHHIEMDEDPMIAFNQERIDVIMEKYGVDAILWTGVITGKVSKGVWDYYVKLLAFITITDYVYNLFTPKGESIIFSLVLDSETGRARMSTFDLVKYVDNNDVIQQRVYDIIRQVKKKRKKRRK